jgi:hypothetical protein
MADEAQNLSPARTWPSRRKPFFVCCTVFLTQNINTYVRLPSTENAEAHRMRLLAGLALTYSTAGRLPTNEWAGGRPSAQGRVVLL